jgi:exodeoxyribonuclease VII large subunit
MLSMARMRRTQPATGDSPSPASHRPLTVSELSAAVKRVLAENLPQRVRVLGQISNFSARTHWFFSLKDEGSAMRCVCFASTARRVNFPVSDGLEVIATGRVDYYEGQGQLQLYVDALEPVGQGALEMQFQALCRELRELGYFAPERKKPLPTFAQRIAVVTSSSAAALQDVINTAARRWPACQLLLVDVRVQGAAAAPQIAAALNALSQHGERHGIDAILLTRGGGSIEDLWAFNERIVADAVYRCRLPIVAAIGHETDTTIAELVADLRCATPTQAAMMLVPDCRALLHQVKQIAHRVDLLASRRVQLAQQRLHALARHRMFRHPVHMIEPVQRRLDDLKQRLQAGLPRKLADQQRRLDALGRQLKAIGPDNVLQRGYSYTLDSEGKVLRDPQQVEPGAWITSVLAEGKLHSQVGGVAPSPGSVQPAPAQDVRRRRKRATAPLGEAPGLFSGTESI